MQEISDRWMVGKFPSKEELEHFNNCSGCAHCDYILNIFGQCYCCNILIDKQELYYDCPAGDWYCEDCIGAMPEYNTNHFVLCGFCTKRDTREKMHIYHENFDITWTCHECVKKSIIHNRFEILDI